MNKWREVRLGEVADVNMGQSPKSIYYNNLGEGTKFLQGNRTFGRMYPTFDTYTTKVTKLVSKGDILFTVRAPVGNMNIANDNLCIGRGIAGIRGKENHKFLYYSLIYNNELLKTAENGTTYGSVNKSDLENFKFLIPDLETQEKIADVLSTYDELIENNKRRIEILEKTAEEIYKEWFVRMRFPGHENTKFEKGIPEGWEIRKVGDVTKIKSGFAFKSEWWQDNGIPVIKIKDIQNNTVDLTDLSCVSKENADKASQFYVSAGDLLIAMTGATIGKIALVPFCDLMTVNQRVGKFFLGDNPQNKIAFLFCLFLQSHIQEQIITIGNSNAAQPNISPFDIEKIKIIYNESVVNEFNQKMQPCISLILKLQKQNQNLIKQRDLLLPRLMNGTIEVK